MDSPTYDFKFMYNDKIQLSHGSFVPKYARPLLDYMLRIYKESILKKYDGLFDFGNEHSH
jgi:hypothetical protein